MISTTVAALTLAVSAAALPAGGPQGLITYPVGTILKAAALQPQGEEYLSYKYSGPEPSLPFIKKDPANTAQEIELITTNTTSATGYTSLQMRNASQGLEIVAGTLQVADGASSDNFVAWNGALWNNADAPHGFYYCSDPEGAGGSVGAEDASASHNGNGACSDFSLVLIQPSF